MNMLNPLNTKKILFVCIDQIESSESLTTMKDLEVLGNSFDEVHIATFSSKPFLGIQNIEHEKMTVWKYTVSAFPVLSMFSQSFLIKRHLSWQRHFRPTHILSYGSKHASAFAASVSKKFNCPLTIKLGIHDTVSHSFRPEAMYVQARHIIVEGGEKAKKLSLYKEKIVPLAPFFDFEEMLTVPIEPLGFNGKYGKDFFFISHFAEYEKKAMETVCEIMSRLKDRYIKAGYLVFVPYSDMKKARSVVNSYRLKDVIFIEPEQSDMLPVYKGARLYINTLSYDEFSVPVLFSLTLGIPVVTTPTGYIDELYTDSGFERFVVPQKDVEVFYQRITELVEKDFMFSDYKMNSSVIMKKFPHDPIEEYMKKIVTVILD